MKTTDFSSGFFGAGGDAPGEFLHLIHESIWGRSSGDVEIVDDASETNWNEENTKCVVADVDCEDGKLRVGYYSDGAQSAIDVLEPDATMESWSAGWDADGVVPDFLRRVGLSD